MVLKYLNVYKDTLSAGSVYEITKEALGRMDLDRLDQRYGSTVDDLLDSGADLEKKERAIAYRAGLAHLLCEDIREARARGERFSERPRTSSGSDSRSNVQTLLATTAETFCFPRSSLGGTRSHTSHTIGVSCCSIRSPSR
jgi:hypothetical protein